MSATNSTTTISLPLFIGTDKPAWLTDWNGAMNTIDGAIATLQTAESGTATSLASLAQSVEALSGTVSQHTTAIQTVTTATAGNTGSINTINSLIGNGEPTTTDKTIIGAINELHSDQGDLADLTTPAVSLVAAINAVTGGGAVEADDVAYDNTASGLTAANVQTAIDELANHSASGLSLKATIDHSTNTTMGAMAAAIKTAFDSLTADEQKNAIVICGLYVYHLSGPEGRFSCVEISGGALAINVFYPTSYLTLRGTTYADASSTASDSDAYIYA